MGRLNALLPIARYEVEGDSMAPTFVAGERVLINKIAYWFATPRVGDVVVVRDPRARERLLLKRIAGVAPEGGWLVEGDNAEASTDSRAFGAVERGEIVGRVMEGY
jgi:nickel-type superoxide dismutase maturation protease